MMSSVLLTIVEANCRCGICIQGQQFVVGDLCPPICHELWHCMYPNVYTLLNGGTLDAGNTRAKEFTVRCPDEGRVVVRGVVVAEN